jgi:hypothetical protein
VVNSNICYSFLNLKDLVIHTLLQFDLQPDFVCEEVFPACHDDLYVELKVEDFAHRILSDKPDYIADDNFINNLYQSISGSQKRETFKMVHLTDVHFDLKYTVGANSDCGINNVVCCRAEQGFPSEPKNQARSVGEYKCDLPFATVESMGRFIHQLDPDVVVWTGDITSHDLWDYTYEEVLEYTETFGAFLRSRSFMDTPIYPIEGNHDFAVPDSQYFNATDPMIT